MNESSLYNYKLKACQAIDGDTVDAMIDLGFGVHLKTTFRLAGINAPEKRPLKSRKAAMESTKRLQEMINKALESDSLFVHTEKGNVTGKYGRYLGWLFSGEAFQKQASFNQKLVEENLAVLYDGGKRN